MHRSSESIAALAAALAKAQFELSNPEKSLVGIIGADRPGEGTRSFRYAPLSSGLDIVRKALGQQQIATVQTTALDTAAGVINLTTLLADAGCGELGRVAGPAFAGDHRDPRGRSCRRMGPCGAASQKYPDCTGRPACPGRLRAPSIGTPTRPDKIGEERHRLTVDGGTSRLLRD